MHCCFCLAIFWYFNPQEHVQVSYQRKTRPVKPLLYTRNFPSCFYFFPSEAPVTLDPNSGGSCLTVSEHMTRSTVRNWSQLLPPNPERLSSYDVLGSEGFSSGKHSWDVEVGGYWYVGVTTRTKLQTLSLKIWGIYMCVCTEVLRELTPEDYVKVVSRDSFPQKVRVQLDYDQGILSFFDLDRKTPVHTIKITLTEPVFPYFCENTKLLPAELSVMVRQPR